MNSLTVYHKWAVIFWFGMINYNLRIKIERCFQGDLL